MITWLANTLTSIQSSETLPSCMLHGYLLLFPKKVPSSARPIVISNFIGRIYEKIIATRIAFLIPWSERTHGFRKAFSTETALAQITRDIEAKRGIFKHCSILAIDLKNAFIRTGARAILLAAKYHDLPQWVAHAIRPILGTRHIISPQTGKSISGAFGLPQGSPISPILFALVAQCIQADAQDPWTTYADDFTLVVHGKTALDLRNASTEALRRIRLSADCMGLALAEEKTAELIIRGCRYKALRLGREVNQLKILGVTFAKGLNWNTHIKTTILKIKNTIMRLINLKVVDRQGSLYVAQILRANLDYCGSLFAHAMNGEKMNACIEQAQAKTRSPAA